MTSTVYTSTSTSTHTSTNINTYFDIIYKNQIEELLIARDTKTTDDNFEKDYQETLRKHVDDIKKEYSDEYLETVQNNILKLAKLSINPTISLGKLKQNGIVYAEVYSIIKSPIGETYHVIYANIYGEITNNIADKIKLCPHKKIFPLNYLRNIKHYTHDLPVYSFTGRQGNLWKIIDYYNSFDKKIRINNIILDKTSKIVIKKYHSQLPITSCELDIIQHALLRDCIHHLNYDNWLSCDIYGNKILGHYGSQIFNAFKRNGIVAFNYAKIECEGKVNIVTKSQHDTYFKTNISKQTNTITYNYNQTTVIFYNVNGKTFITTFEDRQPSKENPTGIMPINRIIDLFLQPILGKTTLVEPFFIKVPIDTLNHSPVAFKKFADYIGISSEYMEHEKLCKMKEISRKKIDEQIRKYNRRELDTNRALVYPSVLKLVSERLENNDHFKKLYEYIATEIVNHLKSDDMLNEATYIFNKHQVSRYEKLLVLYAKLRLLGITNPKYMFNI